MESYLIFLIYFVLRSEMLPLFTNFKLKVSQCAEVDLSSPRLNAKFQLKPFFSIFSLLFFQSYKEFCALYFTWGGWWLWNLDIGVPAGPPGGSSAWSMCTRPEQRVQPRLMRPIKQKPAPVCKSRAHSRHPPPPSAPGTTVCALNPLLQPSQWDLLTPSQCASDPVCCLSPLKSFTAS